MNVNCKIMQMESDSVLNVPTTRREFMRIMFTAGAMAGGAALIPRGKVLADAVESTSEDIYLDVPYLKPEIPTDSLGDVDEKDSSIVYPRAIKEGGILKTEAYDFKVTYKGGVFDYKTFMFSPEEGKLPSAGDILPYMYAFTELNDKEVKVKNLAVTSQAQRSASISLRKGESYCVIPMVTVGNSSDIVNQGNRVPSGFEIESINGANRGYLSFALLAISKERNSDGTLGLQMIGVIDNTQRGGGVFLVGNFPDEKTCKKFNIGK